MNASEIPASTWHCARLDFEVCELKPAKLFSRFIRIHKKEDEIKKNLTEWELDSDFIDMREKYFIDIVNQTKNLTCSWTLQNVDYSIPKKNRKFILKNNEKEEEKFLFFKSFISFPGTCNMCVRTSFDWGEKCAK